MVIGAVLITKYTRDLCLIVLWIRLVAAISVGFGLVSHTIVDLLIINFHGRDQYMLIASH